MTALLHVTRRPAEAADEEIPQSLFGAVHVFLRIHRSENVIGRHLLVERSDEALEALFADLLVDITVGKHRCGYDYTMDGAPKSAYELAMERLKKKDADAGVSERSLSEEQK